MAGLKVSAKTSQKIRIGADTFRLKVGLGLVLDLFLIRSKQCLPKPKQLTHLEVHPGPFRSKNSVFQVQSCPEIGPFRSIPGYSGVSMLNAES